MSAVQRRTLGRTGLTVSELAFGAAPLGNLYAPVSDEIAAVTVAAAWEGGVRYFDVAPHYGLGLAERRLGRALAERPRAEYVISTKVGRVLEPNPAPEGRDREGFAVADTLVRRRDYSSDGVRRSLEASLDRLGLDHVDILLVHDPEAHMEQAIAEAVPALLALREEGVIRALGVGMNLVDPLRRFVRETEIDVVLVAGRYTPVDRTGAALLEDCVEHGVAAIAAAPFNSGLLTSDRIPDASRFDYGEAPDDVLRCARQCARVCRRHGVPLPAAALRFALGHPATAAVLAGMRSPEEVRANLAWMATEPPEDLWAQLPRPARA